MSIEVTDSADPGERGDSSGEECDSTASSAAQGGHAVFFASTGRCGTQWLAAQLGAAAGPQVSVRHEPLAHRYLPRRAMAEGVAPAMAVEPAIAAHFDAVERIVDGGGIYIETGWPVFPYLEYLARRLQGRMRIVHLTRHPVYFALSLYTHGFYDDGYNVEYNRDAALRPAELGRRYGDYARSWARLHRYEKCLFQWLAINELALDLNRRLPDVPWLLLHMEEVFARNSPALPDLLRFVDAGFADNDIDTSELVDRFHVKAGGDVPVECVRRHCKVLKLARRLGYDPLDFDDRRIRARYNLGLARDRSGRFRPFKPLRKWLAANRRKGNGD